MPAGRGKCRPGPPAGGLVQPPHDSAASDGGQGPSHFGSQVDKQVNLDVEHSAFPTEGRERQKEQDKLRKAAGIEKKKRKFHIEEHYDDCGTDLSGLGADALAQTADYLVMPEESHDEHPDDDVADGLETHWFTGSETPPGLPPRKTSGPRTG